MTEELVFARRAFTAFQRADWPTERWELIEFDGSPPVLFEGDTSTTLMRGDQMPATAALVLALPKLFQAVAGGRR